MIELLTLRLAGLQKRGPEIHPGASNRFRDDSLCT